MMSDDNIIDFPIKTEAPDLPPVNLTFTAPDGTIVGQFLYHQSTGKWTFEGDMEESAQKFINFLTNVMNPQQGA